MQGVLQAAYAVYGIVLTSSLIDGDGVRPQYEAYADACASCGMSGSRQGECGSHGCTRYANHVGRKFPCAASAGESPWQSAAS
jgi:hypothetical protein